MSVHPLEHQPTPRRNHQKLRESAAGDGRDGPQERSTDECLGLLGKLGRLFPHDLCQTP